MGPAAHKKKRKNVLNITWRYEDFGVPADWHIPWEQIVLAMGLGPL
jgi:hypothetical protein